MNPDIETVLAELAQTAQYLQQSGTLMRESVQHLIEAEQRIEQSNAFMRIVIDRIERAITAAIKAGEREAHE